VSKGVVTLIVKQEYHYIKQLILLIASYLTNTSVNIYEVTIPVKLSNKQNNLKANKKIKLTHAKFNYNY